MVFSSKIESLAQRFAPYIDELQDFFSSRKVPFGTVADLQAFPARLREEAFHEEMVSMVRSILYRESEAVPRTELMDLLAIAVGGLHFEEAAAELHEPLRELLVFVTEVVRSQRVTLPAGFNAEDEAPSPAAGAVTAPVEAPEPLQLVFNEDRPVGAAVSQQREPVPSAPAAGPSLATNDRLSRALMETEAEGSAEPSSEPAVPPLPASAEAFRSTEQTPRFAAARADVPPPYAQSSRSVASFLRRAYWIPGLLVLLLVLAVAYSLRNRSNPAAPRAAGPGAPVTAGNPLLPKPSAYGPAVNPGKRQSASPQDTAEHAYQASLPVNVGDTRPTTDNVASTRTERPLPAHAKRGEIRSTLATSSVTPRILGGREGVFLASSGMMAAHLLTAPAPHYPKLASLTHVEGEVIVQVVVARDGRVEATRVLEGPRLLRGAAEHAIRRWRYRPYLVDGKPTDVATIVTVNFRLTR